MKKFISLAILLSILLAALPVFAQNTTTTKVTELNPSYFPLIKGWFWTYNYLDEEQTVNNEGCNATIEAYGEKVPIKRTKLQLTTEVKAVTENDDAILGHLAGNSLNLIVDQEHPTNFFTVISKKTGNCLLQIGDLQNDLVAGNITEPEFSADLAFPLEVGKGWGNIGIPERQDHWYQWYVEGTENVKVPAGEFLCFRAAYRSCPDHHIIWFCPGIGIVKQEYVHHGTITNISMELVDYGLRRAPAEKSEK